MSALTPKRFAIILVVYTMLYGVGAMLLKPGHALNAFGNVGQCIIQAAIVVAIGMNLSRTRKHGNAFWLLMSLGAFLWFIAQVAWTYCESYLQIEVPNAYVGDLLFFLHCVPIIAATSTHEEPRRRPPPAIFSIKIRVWLGLRFTA